MRVLQIAFAMVVGAVYIAVTGSYPEMGALPMWGLRIGVLLLIGVFFSVTNILSGRAPDASPLNDDEVPSLNLSAGSSPDSPKV